MEKRRLLILYGSETGTAQDVAERIWRDAKRLQFKSPVQPMDEYEVKNLIFENLVIFVCSTTGQGDPPMNMRKFWKFLLRKNLPTDSLKYVRYAVLGLGDSSYVKFNYAAKKLHKRLLGLGGSPVCEVGLADDQHDLGADAVIDPWINNLWKTLDVIYHFPDGSLPINYKTPPIPRWKISETSTLEKKIFDFPIGNSSEKNYKLVITENKRVTSSDHFQEVRLIRFSGHNVHWNCGDVAVVRPQNRSEAVSLLFSVLPFHPETILVFEQNDVDSPVPLQLSHPISLWMLALNYWDLSAVPRRYALQVLASCSSNEIESERLRELAAGGEDWTSYALRPKRSVVEVLADFPISTSSLTISLLPEIFQPIRPRSFSISSPPQFTTEDGSGIELLVAVVKYKTKLFLPRYGLCSNWLASLIIGTLIDVTVRKGSMIFPDKMESVVMVGPGTGVAPFRSYIKSIESGGRGEWGGDLCLFFGCRYKDKDFFFKEEWPNIPRLQLFTAFSRDQPNKVYVQHVIEKEGPLIVEMLYKKKGLVFVAGNAKEMPEDVKNAFVEALTKYSMDLNKEQALVFIQQMIDTGKYQTETWS